jgi:multicomponent Na+:H+ antiporter subunit F
MVRGDISMIIGMAIFLVVLAMISSYRLIIGPTITDRLIAADTMIIFISLVILLLALYINIELLIDIVLSYAILLFVDVLIFAKYFEYKELYK